MIATKALYMLESTVNAPGLPSTVNKKNVHLGRGLATHFSTLAWRIPWTEEPGGLQSIGLQRVRHN